MLDPVLSIIIQWEYSKGKPKIIYSFISGKKYSSKVRYKFINKL